MSRRNAAVKRPVLPDPQFNSRLASMMISRLMKHGKKSTAQRILSDAFSLISERTGGNAVELFETAVKMLLLLLRYELEELVVQHIKYLWKYAKRGVQLWH